MSRDASNLSSPTRRRFVVRFSLASILLLMVPLGLGFVWLRNYLETRPILWAPYSADVLEEHLGEGRTVLVAFGAAWSFHEEHVLETPAVRRAIRSQDIVAMRADYTSRSPEVGAALKSLGSPKTLPVVAVYTGRAPDKPIVLASMITEQEVLAALGR